MFAIFYIFFTNFSLSVIFFIFHTLHFYQNLSSKIQTLASFYTHKRDTRLTDIPEHQIVLFQAQAQRNYVTKSDQYYRGYGCHRERNEYSFNDSVTTEYTTDLNNNNVPPCNTSSNYSYNYYHTTPRSCSLNNIPNVSTPKSKNNSISSINHISPINKIDGENISKNSSSTNNNNHNNNSLNQPNQRSSISNINYNSSSLSTTHSNMMGQPGCAGAYQYTSSSNMHPNYYYNHHHPHHHAINTGAHPLPPSSISSSIYGTTTPQNHNNNHPFQEDVKARPHYVNLDILPANFKINLNNRKDRKKFINMGYNHSRNDERILFSFADWE